MRELVAIAVIVLSLLVSGCSTGPNSGRAERGTIPGLATPGTSAPGTSAEAPPGTPPTGDVEWMRAQLRDVQRDLQQVRQQIPGATPADRQRVAEQLAVLIDQLATIITQLPKTANRPGVDPSRDRENRAQLQRLTADFQQLAGLGSPASGDPSRALKQVRQPLQSQSGQLTPDQLQRLVDDLSALSGNLEQRLGLDERVISEEGPAERLALMQTIQQVQATVRGMAVVLSTPVVEPAGLVAPTITPGP